MMRQSTIDALEGSIAKWEAIVLGRGVDKGQDNCPLCQRFIAGNCRSCPVQKKTRARFCNNTPYRHWKTIAWVQDNDGSLGVRGRGFGPLVNAYALANALEMLDLLISLREPRK